MSTSSRTLRTFRAVLLTSLVSVELGAQVIGPKIGKCTFTARELYDFSHPRGWSLKCYASAGVAATPVLFGDNVGCRFSGSVLLTGGGNGHARLFYKPGEVTPDPNGGWKVNTVGMTQTPWSLPANGNNPDHALIARTINLATGDTSQTWQLLSVTLERPLGVCSRALAETF